MVTRDDADGGGGWMAVPFVEDLVLLYCDTRLHWVHPSNHGGEQQKKKMNVKYLTNNHD